MTPDEERNPMLFKWFATAEVNALATSMANDLVKRVPPASLDARGKKAEAKQAKAHDLVLRQAHDFARRNKLNIYTKARLANGFKWALLEAGYPKAFVDKMTYELATVVAAAESERKT
jgi:hypothetical protein